MVSFQIDLTDMETKPDGAYHYICHTVDHFSKFPVIFSLPSKNATVVATEFKRHVMSYFGLLKIIYSDNGSEFVNDAITALVVLWPGHAKFVNSGPGLSQSQRLVEQRHNSVRCRLFYCKIHQIRIRFEVFDIFDVLRNSNV